MATLAIEWTGRLLALSDYTHVALAALFLWVAVRKAQEAPGGLRAHGLWLGGLLEPAEEAHVSWLSDARDLLRTGLRALPSAAREVGYAWVVAALVFPPFVLAFRLFHGPTHPFQLVAPEAPFDQVAAQLLVIGLPEEAFFRGYLQTRLDRHFTGRRPILGIAISVKALLLQAALFALLHFLVEPNPARLAVFFPALLFGYMREARGGIGAAFVFHALCNLLSDLLVRGYLY